MAYKKFNPKKTGKKIYKKVYGSRTVPQAVSATGKVARDVLALTKTVGMLASRLNVEKKSQQLDLGTSPVGQTNANLDGNLFVSLTPSIVQGVDSNQRIGNSLKLTGMNIPIQFSSQGNTFGDRRIRVQIFKITSADNGVTADEAFNDYYDVNPLNGIRDMNAPRKYATTKQNGIKCLRTKYYTLKGIQINTTASGDDSEKQSLSVNLPLKMDDVLRYDSSSNTFPDGVRYFMVIQVDAGNCGTTPTTTLDVPITKDFTGVSVRMCQKYWWVDN